MTHIERLSSYEEIYGAFRWNIPARYNIATDVCDRHATDASKVALIGEDSAGKTWTMSFRHVQRQANRLANLLVSLGLQRGDRVMLLMVQDPWVAIGHIACWKAGLVSLPCSVLFGPDAVAYRLDHAGVRVVITDSANLPKVIEARDKAPSVEKVFLVDGADAQAEHLDTALEPARDAFTTVDTGADDPAFFNFTSGTTGNPKGALQPHRSMLGHLPGLEFMFEFFPQPRDVMWSPADWAWLAGLMDVLMPAWYHGVPVVTSRAMRFDPEAACALMARHQVRTALLTPTALRMMRQVKDPLAMGVDLRVVLSGGEAVGKELHEWAGATLKTTINEGFGQTECNLVLGNCASVMPVRPGSLGRPAPGHVCAIVDDQGRELKAGEIGHIAVRRPDPVMMLEYWNNPKATAEKYIGDWLITGDLGMADDDGYFWFHGRADDIISSSGYRIGPTEIEDALTRHPAVMLAAVVGVPDPVRTESIKAFVVLRKDFEGGDALAEEIRSFVRERLAKHEVPREIAFMDALPMTTTGKVLRRELRDAEKKKAADRGGA
ncbi:AMP-binding protein [Panacagrimonas sp.]|uniref:AMP-binding protein n=1 Tax=Panacagrimonas sp. TaxID=2480088 RepID=UPI003B519468